MTIETKKSAVLLGAALLCLESSCFEDVSHEIVEMRMDRIISVISALYIVPDMRDIILFHIVVIAGRNGINCLVIITCCEEDQMRIVLCAEFEVSRSARGRADSADIAEQVGTLCADEK